MSFITSNHTRRWPGGCVVWQFHQGLSDHEKELCRNAMDYWAARANVRFVERSTQSSFVTFISDSNIDGVNRSDSIGMDGGEQFILLEPDVSAGAVRHEIGHAVGLKHEHMRCDRSDFVDVSNKLKPGRSRDYEKLCGNDFTEVGDYDFSSIMHYGQGTNDTTDGSPALSGTNDRNQELLENRPSGKASPGDIAGIAKLHGGNAHVYQLSHDGQIEKTVEQNSWSDGWTIATPFQMDVRNFMLFLKKSNGEMDLNSINWDGSIGGTVQERDWSSGWTTAIKYAIGPFNYFLFYKRGNGKVDINNINMDGKIGSLKVSTDLEKGWTSVRHYAIGLSNFLFFMNANTGEWRVRNIAWDGTVGDSTDAGTWTEGWTSVEPYSAGGNSYLFHVKAGSGKMAIRPLRGDGTVGSRDTNTRDWTSGWTNAIPYEIAGNPYLLLLKAGTGRLEICRLDSDGTIGVTTDKRSFGLGWRVGVVYHVGVGTFLILIKT
jgi:hypothetical protein